MAPSDAITSEFSKRVKPNDVQTMTCREFEDAMLVGFKSVDRQEWKSRITREHWDGLPLSEAIAHLKRCNRCQTSLFQYLDVRDFLRYESQPCFHVAYYSANSRERCLDVEQGLYTIITDRARGTGVVIGFCPWCGISLPVAISSRPRT